MRLVSLVLAAVLLLSAGLGSAIALDADRFDKLVEKLEAVMEDRDIGAAAMARALERYGAKQTDPERIELVAALAAHFADGEARVAWLKKHALVVKTVPAPRESGARTAADQPAEETEKDCPADSHPTATGGCEKDTQACYVENGSGETRWDADRSLWGTCEATACDKGYARSEDGASCEAESAGFPGCDEDDRLLGNLFWSMCDSTGSYYLNYYFSRLDTGRACPAGYRVPTAAEWHDAYEATLGSESESDENRWKYAKKLADDLRLSSRGQISLNSGYRILPNSFSLEAPSLDDVDYGDIPKEERSDRSLLVPDRAYGDYRYLAADGLFSLYRRYDADLGLSLAQFYAYGPSADTWQADRTLMAVRCVRDGSSDNE